MALGQHLGTDQNIRFTAVNAFQHGLPLLAAFHRVAVDAQNTRFRKLFLQPAFKTLRAAAKGKNVLIAAGWAGTRHMPFKAAVVAAQAPVGQMQH